MRRPVVNSAGTVAGVVGVAVAGLILEAHEEEGGEGGGDSGWPAVFALAAGVSYVCAALFAVFASVEDEFSAKGWWHEKGEDPEGQRLLPRELAARG